MYIAMCTVHRVVGLFDMLTLSRLGCQFQFQLCNLIIQRLQL